MSGQAGIFYFDERPISPQFVGDVSRSIETRGPDDEGHFVDAGIAMVSRAFHVTKEDRRERLPLTSHSGLVVTWDGRLDNRDDLLLQLRRTLESNGVDSDHATDAVLAATCFERWGEDGLARLIGDWSLAIWKPSTRELLLSSDYMGARPFYYRAAPDHVIWSSCLETIIRFTSCQDDLEKRYIAGLLIAGPPPQLTPYRDVLCVPAGEALTFSRHGSSSRRFWHFDVAPIRYRRDTEYEEHFRHVFRDAVGSRLRVDGPIAAELSGGWDSSAIVCMARHIMRSSSVDARELFTVSYVSHVSRESDETRFIEAVERDCGIQGYHFKTDDYAWESMNSWISPIGEQRYALDARSLVRNRGARLLLTGRVGDAVMGSFTDLSVSLADLLATGHLLAFVAEGRAWSRATGKPFIGLVPEALRPLLPGTVQLWLKERKRVAKTVAKTRAEGTDLQSLFGVHPSLARRIPHVYAHEAHLERRFWPPSKRDLVTNVRLDGATRRFVYPEAGRCLEHSHPYTDRRLVSFVLAIPTNAWCRPGEPRSLMRRALADLLPERVVKRFSKGYAAPLIARAIRSTALEWLEDIHQLAIVQHEFVSAEHLERRLRRMLAASGSAHNVPMMMALELWLQKRAARQTESNGLPDRRDAGLMTHGVLC